MSRQGVVAALLLLSLSGLARAVTREVPKEHTSIQAAIDASKTGDIVLVAAGTYREQVKLKPGVTLKSAGNDDKGKLGLARAEATIITGAGADSKGPAVSLAEGATLDGFTITRVGVFDEKEFQKHYDTQGENLPDEQGAVGRGGYPAVEVAGVTSFVRHNIVHDNGCPGIGCVATVAGRNASLISGNVVFRNMGGGIGIADGAAPTVSGNRCYRNLRGGIGNRKSSGLLIDNDCYDNVRAGIGIREGATPTVCKNRCYRNRRAGIGCRMEGTAPVIEDNDCYENAMAGIGSRDGARALIRGNRCYQNTLAGIGTRDGARAVISGNKCYRNQEAGIGTRNAHAVITGNECYENEQAGIGQRENADTVLSGNHVHHNKKAGIGFDDCKTGRATVLDNRVLENEFVAIGVHAGWQVRLSGNTLARKGGLPPLVMIFKDAEADLTDNTLTGTGVAGVRVEGTARVVNNRFECGELRKGGPPQFAVWGLPGARIVFTGNKVKGWRHALFADQCTATASFNEVSDHWGAGLHFVKPQGTARATNNVFRGGQPGVVVREGTVLQTDNREEK